MVLLLAAAAPACGQDDAGTDGPDSTERSIATETPIVFRSQVADGPGELYAMAPDGSDLRRLSGDGDFSVPEWSPDGQSIAFRDSSSGTSAEVGVMSSDGSSPVLLTEGESATALDVAVHWSPDGEELAYGSWPEIGVSNVWAVSRLGGAPRPLLEEIGGSQETARWSPVDPELVVYTEFGENRTLDLWTVSLEAGAEPVNLTEGRVYAPRYPEWSPDGTRIVFSGYGVLPDGTLEGLEDHGGGFMPPDGEIFVIDVATRELTRVTDDAWDEATPTWAPDGERLVVASARDGDMDLWLIALDDPAQAQNLIDDAAEPREDVMPNWYKAP